MAKELVEGDTWPAVFLKLRPGPSLANATEEALRWVNPSNMPNGHLHAAGTAYAAKRLQVA